MVIDASAVAAGVLGFVGNPVGNTGAHQHGALSHARRPSVD
jgi:hypothetical protein